MVYQHNLLAYRMAKSTRKGDAVVKRGAEILAGPYPKSFADFIGQETARDQIIAAITSAALRHTRLDHMLLASGLPGIGKTTLARLTAALRDVGFVEAGGSIGDRDAVRLLGQMQDKDILFIDEIHRLVSHGKAKAEWLLTLLQDGTIQLPIGTFQAPDITVIAATTDAQRLPETILDRFPIKPMLSPYTDTEAVAVGLGAARRLGFGANGLPLPTDRGWLLDVAKASDNNPRRIEQLLKGVRDVALATQLGNYTESGYDVSTALEWNGLTSDGLTRTAQEYLVGLFAYGGTAGVGTLKALLNEEQIAHTEKHLIQKGLIEITGRGRALTELGAERAQQLALALMEKQEEDK